MEKRRFPRTSCQIPARWQNLAGGPAEPVPTLVRDISEGGIRFRSNAFLAVQSRLRFKLEFPGGRPIEAPVEPVWVREIPAVGQFEVGARFLTLSEPERAAIRDFVSASSLSR